MLSQIYQWLVTLIWAHHSSLPLLQAWIYTSKLMDRYVKGCVD